MTQPKYTPEQAEAITKRGVSIALDAGAGCGKTFVLTERYLAHLPPGEVVDILQRLDEVVAITFTNAAAREMRERIRHKCFARMEGAATPDEGDYWLRLIRVLDAARISTIDSFCQTLVRQAAPRLGIDPTFEVLDAAAAPVLLSEVADDVLRGALQAEEADAIELAVALSLGGLRSAVMDLAEYQHDPAFSEWLAKDETDCLARWRQFYAVEYVGATIGKVLASDDLRALRVLIAAATPVTLGLAEHLAEMLRLIGELENGADPLAAARELHGLCFLNHPETNKYRWNNRDWPTVDEKKAFSAACQEVRKPLEPLLKEPDKAQWQVAAERGVKLLKLAARVAEAYQTAKRERGALDFADLSAFARRVLTEEALADVRQEQAGRIRLLLVDEFQDTSQAQVDLVLALVSEGFDAGRLFFVGDFKQSIYRFRGAEPEVFRALQTRVPAQGRLPLATNFRSQPGVIGFVNALFAPEFGEHYQPLHAARAAASEANVEFLWTTRSDGPAKGHAGFADANRKAEALTIASRLRELIDSEQPLVVDAQSKKLRAVRPGDVAILFRAFSNVHLYEQALRAADLPFYTVAGRAFYSQQEVYDVLHLLRAVTSTCDDIALAGVLRSPFFGLRDETLLAISRLEGNLNAGLARGRLDRIAEPVNRERAEAAREVLRELRHAAPGLSTPALLELAFARTGYDAALLAEFLGERKLANVRKLVEQARRSDAAGGSLATFIRQLGEFTAREPKEAQAATVSGADDVVRLMTIHGSKGLEFPVVVVADLDSPKQNRGEAVVFSPSLGPLVKGDNQASVGLNLHNAVEKQAELAETLRLFYVACTRAADQLILSGTLADPDQPKGPFTKVLARQFDIQTGRQVGEEPALAPVPTSFTPRTMAELDIKQPRSVKLTEALETMRDVPPQELPTSAFPLAIDARSQRAFSVSRLTGKLWRRSEFAAREVKLPAAGDIDPRGLGTLVHAVLERLTLRGDEAIAAWCERLAPLNVNRSVDETAALATQLLTRFVASTRYEALAAAPQVEREVEFLLAWPPDSAEPHAMLSGYIDGAYQLPDGRWQIVDYKTNQVTAGEVSSEAKKYELQLAVYALAIEAATGQPPAGMTLHFLRPGVEYEFVWNPTAKLAALAMIESAIAAARAAEENT